MLSEQQLDAFLQQAWGTSGADVIALGGIKQGFTVEFIKPLGDRPDFSITDGFAIETDNPYRPTHGAKQHKLISPADVFCGKVSFCCRNAMLAA